VFCHGNIFLRCCLLSLLLLLSLVVLVSVGVVGVIGSGVEEDTGCCRSLCRCEMSGSGSKSKFGEKDEGGGTPPSKLISGSS